MTYQGTVLVIGSTGETGVHVVRKLRARGISTRAHVRSLDKAKSIEGLGAELVTGHLGDATDSIAILADVTAVICTIGARAVGNPQLSEEVEYRLVASLVDAAKAAGVAHFVFCTSLGTEAPEMIPFLTAVLKEKRKAELHLIQSGLPYTIVRPGGLINDPATNQIKAGYRNINGRIPREDVAEVLVQALLQPDSKNKILEIVSEPGAGPADRTDLFAAGISG